MAADALKWVSEMLREHGIPFQICGGLAAIGYGSPRPLYDIDLFVPEEHFSAVVSKGNQFISKPAMRYVEHQWDVKYVQFVVFGTKVEVASASGAKVFDARLNHWVDLNIDFSRSHIAALFGQEVPIMEKSDLIRYKKALGRAVDQEDVEAIERL